MTTIYLIRHGQTDTNIKDGFNGSATDQPLNAVGEQMAADLTPVFADIPLDVIYSSPLRRAMKTAEGVRGDRPLEILVDPALRETDFGELDGLDWLEAKKEYPRACYQWIHDVKHFRAPGATEGVRDVSVRVVAAFLRILRENRGKTVAIVGHGMAFSLLTAKLLGKSAAQYRLYPMLGNTAYRVLEIEDDGHFYLDRWEHNEHVRPEWRMRRRHMRHRIRRARSCLPGTFFWTPLKITKKERSASCPST